MLKQIRKKILFLLFPIAALTQFGSTKPMLKLFTCCFGEKHTTDETKITELPTDCWREIFQFADFKLLLVLSQVCKNFRKKVKSCHAPLSLTFDYKNRKNISLGKVLGTVGKVLGTVEKLFLFNCDFEKTKIAWPEKLLYLNVEGFIGFNSETLKTGLEKLQELELRDSEDFNLTENQNLKNLNRLTVFHCNRFTGGKGLKHLTSLLELKVFSCNEFAGTEVENLTELRKLEVYWCNKFIVKGMENLTKLRELSLHEYCDKFNTGLLKLSLRYYCDATQKGLKTLKNLEELRLNRFVEFNGPLEVPESLRTLYVTSSNEFTEEWVENLINLHDLRIMLCPNFNENSKIIKKLKEKGCEVTLY